MKSNVQISTKDKITAAKVRLNQTHPFYAYLIMCADIKEVNYVSTFGVDHKGNMCYNKGFVDSISISETQAVLVHEILHLILNHCTPLRGRHKELMGLAVDIKVNNIISKENLKLPEGGHVPKGDEYKIDFFPSIKPFKIKNISELTYLEIYGILEKKVKDQSDGDGDDFKDMLDQLQKALNNGTNSTGGDGDGNPDNPDDNGNQRENGKVTSSAGFDEHLHSDSSESIEDEEERTRAQNKWKIHISEAITIAKQRGLTPAGMERILDGLMESKIPWRVYLQRFITQYIPYDYSYSYPHKKSISTKIYMPHIVKEGIDIIVHSDTSGSTTSVLPDFMSEVKSILMSYVNVNMTFIQCDAEIQTVDLLTPNNIHDIQNMTIKGGGGTSHNPVVEWINENKPNAKVFVSLTDGYSDIEECYSKLPESLNKLLVLTSDAQAERFEKYAEVIKLD